VCARRLRRAGRIKVLPIWSSVSQDDGTIRHGLGVITRDTRGEPWQLLGSGRVFRVVSQRGVWVFQNLEHGRSQLSTMASCVCRHVCKCMPRDVREMHASTSGVLQRAWMFEHRRVGVNDWQRSGRWSARQESASAGGINKPKLHDEADPGRQHDGSSRCMCSTARGDNRARRTQSNRATTARSALFLSPGVSGGCLEQSNLFSHNSQAAAGRTAVLFSHPRAIPRDSRGVTVPQQQHHSALALQPPAPHRRAQRAQRHTLRPLGQVTASCSNHVVSRLFTHAAKHD
jgi:hypothetical protein